MVIVANKESTAAIIEGNSGPIAAVERKEGKNCISVMGKGRLKRGNENDIEICVK